MATEDIWGQFASDGTLSETKCRKLQSLIASEVGERLTACIRIYSDRCRISSDTAELLNTIITEEKNPSAVAAAMTALRDSEVKMPGFLEIVHRFLDYDRYQGRWYDATISSIGYYHRFASLDEREILRERYKKLLTDAETNGDDDLIAFCKQGETH